MKKIANLFKNEYYIKSTCEHYHIFGFDYIITKDLQPYVIEVNSYPSLSKSSNDNVNQIKINMLNDIYDSIIVNKRMSSNFEILAKCNIYTIEDKHDE